MEQRYPICGRTAIVQQLENVDAIPPSRERISVGAPDSAIPDFTAELRALPPAALRALRAFCDSGWRFVPAGTASERAQHLYLHENGQLTIDTGFVVLRLHDAVTDLEVDALLAEHRLAVVRRLRFQVHLYVVRGPDSISPLDLASMLARESRVAHAEPHMIEHLPARTASVEPVRQWQWQNTAAEAAWVHSRGADTVIAIVDHGFHLHVSGFNGSIVAGAGSFTPLDDGDALFARSVADMPGGFHGTFCAGLALARRGHGSPICGMAPEAGFLPIACEPSATSSQLTLARAIAYAANPWTEVNQIVRPADVISCSLGPERWHMRSVLEDALRYASFAGRAGLGVPVFWAVTNEEISLSEDHVNKSGLTIPVGRSDCRDRRVPCGFGAQLAFLATGQHVLSLLEDDTVAAGSGTSYATPCAAGIAALLIALDPTLTRREILEVMQRTCDPPLEPYSSLPDPYFGYGRVNAGRAVQAVLTARATC
jgi:thermitase